jgi:riboflavin synthase
MFTGLIKEIGTIEFVSTEGNGLVLGVSAPILGKTLTKGDSININGACQTITKMAGDSFEVLATAETAKRTNFRFLRPGVKINLEPPLTLSDPLGGHLVSGHIDDTGQIISIRPSSESTILEIKYDSIYGKYLIEKGSVAVDGISLTCYEINASSFAVSLIPETLINTNLQFRSNGDLVNLEFDQIGKYIEKMLNSQKEGVTWELLRENGF